MNRDQLSEEEIFEKAYRMESLDARVEYLKQACRDDGQIDRVLALLQEGAPEASFLERGPACLRAADVATSEDPKRIGDFEILGVLGRGGMGVVYRARQRSLNRLVALKVLSIGLGLTTKAIMRFKREAEAAAKLHHTNIVPIYWTGDENRVPYYAMELIDGPSLDQVIRQLRADVDPATVDSLSSTHDAAMESEVPIPAWVEETIRFPTTRSGSKTTTSTSSSLDSSSSIGADSSYYDKVANMMAGVADALAHAHDHGIIHRDIKPANLLLSSDGVLSINDFGLARMLEQPGMTMTGEFMGSPMYMSPEQIAAGRLPLDHRTDIYSLGASLYQTLTLEPPFPGQQRDQVLSQIVHKDPPPPRSVNKQIPKDLETICLKAMEKDPDARYQTADAMAKDLRSFVNRHAISARRIGPIERTVRWARRNRALAAAIACAMILGGVALFATVKFELVRLASRAVERERVKREAMTAAMGGKLEKARESIKEARALDATVAWEETVKCQLALAQGQNQKALAHIQRSLAEKPDDLTALAMQADVFYNNGRWWDYLSTLQRIDDFKVDTYTPTPENQLFLARAWIYIDPYKAKSLIDEAMEGEERYQPNYQLVSAGVKAWYASDQRDPKALQEALYDADLAVRQWRTNAIAHAVQLTVRIHAALLDGSDPISESKYLKLAAENVKQLEDLPEYFAGRYARSTYYELMNDYEAAVRSMIGEDESIQGFGAARLVTSAYALDDVKATLERLDRVQPRSWIIEECRLLLMLGIRGGHERAKKTLQDDVLPRLGHDRQDDRGMIDFLWILGEAENARQMATSVLAQYEGVDCWQFPRARLRFYADEIGPEQLIDAAGGSHRDLGIAHFAIGVRHLAQGEHLLARLSFEKSVSQGQYFWRDVFISRTLLTLMNGQGGKDWPSWIKNADRN